MASSGKTRVIYHFIGGGWQSDLPTSTSAAPDALSRVVVPYLTEAENCLFQSPSGARKAWGTAALMAALSETATNVKGLYDYWRSPGGTPQQHRILHLDDAIYKDDADQSFSTIKTGLVTDAVPNYSHFDDIN